MAACFLIMYWQTISSRFAVTEGGGSSWRFTTNWVAAPAVAVNVLVVTGCNPVLINWSASGLPALEGRSRGSPAIQLKNDDLTGTTVVDRSGQRGAGKCG